MEIQLHTYLYYKVVYIQPNIIKWLKRWGLEDGRGGSPNPAVIPVGPKNFGP